MSSQISVSKGIFVCKNGFKAASKKSRKKQVSEDLFSEDLWFQTYKPLWNLIETKIQDINNKMFSNVLSNLVTYIKSCYATPVTEIPTAALLTGINMPDHSAQFKTLNKEIKQHLSPHVVNLNGEDCQSLKYLIENVAQQLINQENELTDGEMEEHNRIKKSQCNFSFIQSWYEDLREKKPIVVIISDFESFSINVLQDFISIASSYINIMKFIFVFGVATSVATIHKKLPYHILCKIRIQVFNSTPSTTYLNNVLEGIFFSSDCPFQLGGNVFNLLTDIFLFYDLSVSGFIQNFKYAMLEHFSYGNAMALCRRKNFSKVIAEFSKSDFENVRRLPSFRKLVESQSAEIRIKLLTDDEYFKRILRKEVKRNFNYIRNFHLFLKVLHILVADLPNSPLGKQVRELYSVATSKNITKTSEYKQCFQLLSFQSQGEFCRKTSQIITSLVNNIESLEQQEEACSVIETLEKYLEEINNLDEHHFEEMDVTEDVISELKDRRMLKEKLLSMSKPNEPISQYSRVREKILNYLNNVFETYLQEPNSFYFHEIFFFDRISIQSHIVGSHRAAIHTALNDPHVYLQCSCCEIPNDSIILRSMPDISIAYKLHLECGKMINLYDWLQAFLSIVDPQKFDDSDNKENSKKIQVKPELQARFTQAIAELEYLGFIKNSKRKTDHVARLTWGG